MKNLRAVTTAVLCTLSCISDGMQYGWTAPVIPKLLAKDSYLTISEYQTEWLETILMLGGCCGIPLTMLLVDRIGRKGVLICSSTITLTSWFIIALAPTVEYLYVGRFFAGMAGDAGFIAAPMYIAEVADHRIRGFLSSIIYLMMLAGILLVYCVAPFTPIWVPCVIEPSTSATQHCTTCRIDVPANRWGGHLRTLGHREKCCVMQEEEGVELIRTSFRSRIATYRLTSSQDPTNVKQYLQQLKQKFVKLVGDICAKYEQLKVGLELFGRFLLHSNESEEVKSFNTKYQLVNGATDLEELFEQFSTILDRKYSEFMEKDSGICFNTITLASFPFIPESPYYLVYKDRHKEAKRSLERLRPEDDASVELHEIAIAIRRQKSESGKAQDIILVKSNRKALIIMIWLNGSQHMSSISVMLMNLHSILNEAGAMFMSSSTAGILFSGIMLCAAMSASLAIDNFGRRVLLMTSGVLAGINLGIIAVYFTFKNNSYDTSSVSWIVPIAVLCYAFAFKFGIGLVPIVLTAELFPARMKAIGMTISDACYVGFSVISLQMYIQLKSRYGIHVPFYIFACWCFCTVLFTWFFIPETKGKTLDEIQFILKDEEREKLLSTQNNNTDCI